MRLEKRSRLVMIGDSITDCGRDYNATPAGWGSFGDGYVNLVNACLTGLAPSYGIMVANKGVNGNTIRDLKKRWQKDVLDLKPDYVSVMIGINDVWRHFDGVLQQTEQVGMEEYRRIYDELITETKPKVKDIFIMSPFMIEPNRQDPMRRMVDEYADIARETAARHGLLYVDVQKKIDAFLDELSPYIICSDRVHPNVQGHMIVAKAFLDGLGFSWE